MIDIFAFVGGFLGLFLGMSVLSVVELFYLLVVRPFTNETRTPPNEVNSVYQQIKKYIQGYMENSTIHSFNHISDGKRNVLERIAWFALFILSLIGCAFMVNQLHNKVKINLVTMEMEDEAHNISEIPFPAITFFGNYPKRHSHLETTTILRILADFNVMKLKYATPGIDDKRLDGHEKEIVATIRQRSTLDWFRSKMGKFCKRFGVPTAELLTSRGYGSAFNVLNASELYHEDQ